MEICFPRSSASQRQCQSPRLTSEHVGVISPSVLLSQAAPPGSTLMSEPPRMEPPPSGYVQVATLSTAKPQPSLGFASPLRQSFQLLHHYPCSLATLQLVYILRTSIETQHSKTRQGFLSLNLMTLGTSPHCTVSGPAGVPEDFLSLCIFTFVPLSLHHPHLSIHLSGRPGKRLGKQLLLRTFCQGTGETDFPWP